MTKQNLTSEELKAAREWIAECLWADLDDEDIAGLTERQITRGIARHFAGGIEGFRATF